VPTEAIYTSDLPKHGSGPIMNPSTRGVELPVTAGMQAEMPRIGPTTTTCPAEAPGTTKPEREGTRAAEEQSEPRACAPLEGHPFLFDDPYWDDAFDSYHDPTLRTCCRF
jgi:hypothetical protein